MRKKILVASSLCLCLLITGMHANATNPGSEPFSNMSAQELVDDMGLGWNLGNTLDSYNYNKGFDVNLDSETYWSNPKTTKNMIDTIAASGFKSIRIPVTYYNHLDENYNIDEKWLDRVEEVVNYALDNDLYVVLNIHHDTGMQGWIHADTDTYEQDSEIFKNLWKQIATRFRNYDEKLLFEGTNEILNTNNNWDWGSAYKDFRVVHDLNQDFIDTVRSTGGNNAERFLVLSTWGASSDSCQIEQLFYKEFTDSAEDRLIMSVHNYTSTVSKLDSLIANIDSYSEKYDIPVIIDEFGTTAGQSESFRIQSAETYVSKAKAAGITCFVWDDGGNYKLLDRQKGMWKYPDIVEAMVEAADLTYTDVVFPKLNEISFSYSDNWRAGHYDMNTGNYKSYEGRACFNSYLMVDTNEYVVKAPENYHVLIREIAENGTVLRSFNLGNGETYKASDDAIYVAISLYNTVDTTVSLETYRNLLSSNEIAFKNKTENETGAETGTETETETETGNEAGTKTETGIETETGNEAGTETETETGNEAGTETETGTETGNEVGTKTETEVKTESITILDSMYSTKKDLCFSDADVMITNKTKITLDGTIKTVFYRDILSAASGQYVFRLEDTRGVYRRIGWWNNKIADVTVGSEFSITQDYKTTTTVVNGQTSVDSISRDIAFAEAGVKINLNIMALKELQITDETGTLVRDYVPALDVEGIPCIYDKVTGTCYYLSDTSSLVY